MKILWVKTDFLHPTTRGGQIRTLEMLKRLHSRHEVHYLAFDDRSNSEGPRRAPEYSAKQYAVPHVVAPKRSAAFAGQIVAGLFKPLPLAISRYKSDSMRRTIDRLVRSERYDSVVCDFLVPAVNIDDLRNCVLFQHNVETVIWQRHTQNAADPLRRGYFGLQAKRMFEFERHVCRSVSGIVAVSEQDADLMRSMFGVDRVSAVPTGVDVTYFNPPGPAPATADLVFVGSMDWMPNSDGMIWFVREVLPLIRAGKPDCTVAIVGRNPGPEIAALCEKDARIHVTGTVPDVRPWLWGSKVSIVPLRIGGGTRLKIYEAMAARTAVVSTTVGAEGLNVSSPEHIRLADSPQEFAGACVQLLDDSGSRQQMAESAWDLIASHYSWDHVVQCFERGIGLPLAA